MWRIFYRKMSVPQNNVINTYRGNIYRGWIVLIDGITLALFRADGELGI